MITSYESKINKYIAIFDYIYIIYLRLDYIVTLSSCLFILCKYGKSKIKTSNQITTPKS